MVDPEGRQVDVHPATFDAEGNGRYQMHDGHTWTYGAEGLAGRGFLGRRLLRKRFGVDPPRGYEWPQR